MAFKATIIKLRRTVLCCTDRERKRPLEIGSPTDVRRINIGDSLPGLTDSERRYIRDKASSDAVHLLGLQSEPPSHPATSPPSPTRSRSSSSAPRPASRSVMASREPSMALPNAASKNLPSTLPTPPIPVHNQDSPPSSRMNTMWKEPEQTKHTSACHDQLYAKLEKIKDVEVEEKGLTESFLTLNLDFEESSNNSTLRSDSTRTLSLPGEFEVQVTKGGNLQPMAKNLIVQTAIEATDLDYSSSDESDFEEDGLMPSEHLELVKI